MDGIHVLKAGESRVTVWSPYDDWSVNGKYFGCNKWQDITWIQIRMDNGEIYDYNLSHILAIKVEGK